MDLTELKAKHHDLVAAIISEATAGHKDALASARSDGAKAEMERISAVHAQMFPGHEDLVNTAMFDGKSGAGDVAIAINAANIEAQAKAGEDLSEDAPGAVSETPVKPGSGDNSPGTAKEKEKAVWDKDSKLRADFDDDFEAYESFNVANAAGKIRNSRGAE